MKLSQDDIAANERMMKEKQEQDLEDMKLAAALQQQSMGGI